MMKINFIYAKMKVTKTSITEISIFKKLKEFKEFKYWFKGYTNEFFKKIDKTHNSFKFG